MIENITNNNDEPNANGNNKCRIPSIKQNSFNFEIVKPIERQGKKEKKFKNLNSSIQ